MDTTANYTDTLTELISNNDEMMKDLKMMRALNLPNWLIAAGYVRNYIWDTLHGYSTRTPLNELTSFITTPKKWMKM